MATASVARFFEVTPSSLISKFYGETETLIKTLFKVAELQSPSILFIDEIDSLLTKRRDKEDDTTIRMKNQLLQMMDGVSSDPTKMVGKDFPFLSLPLKLEFGSGMRYFGVLH